MEMFVVEMKTWEFEWALSHKIIDWEKQAEYAPNQDEQRIFLLDNIS